MTEETIKFEIIRTDIFPDQDALKKAIEEFATFGLDTKEEIDKLIWLGYIKKAK